MRNNEQRRPLHRVGAMWKPKPGNRSLGNGTVTINGMRQRFLVVLNDRRTGDNAPDFVLVSADDPEPDDYAQRAPQAAAAPAQSTSRPANTGRTFRDPVAGLGQLDADDIPF